MNGPNNPIGWCDFTWNPVKGLCPVGCNYCYARRIYERFSYDPTIRLDEKEMTAPLKLKKPAKIFVGSTIELFGSWCKYGWIERILSFVRRCPQHTFQFLTKFPRQMAQFHFPENCWCGVTIEQEKYYSARNNSLQRTAAPLRLISFEPLQSAISFDETDLDDIDWVIIGAETGNRRGKIIPEEEWIFDIVDQADDWNVPVFLKDNLKPYWSGELRQEFPE